MEKAISKTHPVGIFLSIGFLIGVFLNSFVSFLSLFFLFVLCCVIFIRFDRSFVPFLVFSFGLFFGFFWLFFQQFLSFSSVLRIPDFFISFLTAGKVFFITLLRRFLSMDESALAAGIFFGDTSYFSSSLLEAFRVTGTSHIVALSGYNITIIVSSVRLFSSQFFSRFLTAAISIVSIFCFVVATGASVSAIRAACMAAIVIVLSLIGRKAFFAYIIVYAAACMVLFRPMFLSGDIGFQLSFASLLGIVILQPYGTLLLCRYPIFVRHPWITEIFSSTIAATVAVSPFLLFYFERTPLFSVVTNILVLPAIPLLMLLIPLLFFVYFIHPILAWLVAIVLNGILHYELFVIHLAQLFSVSFVISDPLSRIIFFFGYLVLAGGFVFFHFQKLLHRDVYP
ncbi:MAG: hypothetical protein RIQ54_106 [Candidatus Parcubacteria bacterium]|jgi:competence protein ComEC